DNSSNATIWGNATVDAPGTIAVTSALTYPPLTPISPSAFAESQLKALQSSGISAITNYLDGTLGFASNFLNTWVIAGAKAFDATKPAPTTAISGAIAVSVYTNASNAVIKSGAKINQTAALQGPNQSVTLSATTTIQMLDVAGLGKWSLNLG